jgi:hypothetical protein
MNRTITNTIFFLSAAAAACAGALLSNSAHASASSISGSSDLVGQITNGNGIRDDVNEYIVATFADDPKKQTAATRFAQANQRMLEVIAENKPVTQDLVTKISYAGQCFAQNMDKKSFTKQAREITARTFNTEARFRAHDEFSKQAHGMSVATSDNVNACEAAK